MTKTKLLKDIAKYKKENQSQQKVVSLNRKVSEETNLSDTNRPADTFKSKLEKIEKEHDEYLVGCDSNGQIIMIKVIK